MSKITNAVRRAADFFSGRVGARMLLILGCLICVSVFSPYFSKVSIVADGKTQTFITTRGGNPEELFTQVGLSLDSGDQYFESSNEDNYSEYRIVRAFEITITDAGITGTYETTGGTVADVLTSAGIALPDEDDIINCSVDDDIYAYMNIVIDRVEYVYNTSEVVVHYQTLKRETDALVKGETEVATDGVDGLKRIETRVKYVNGVYAYEETVSETMLTQPVNEVIDVGTASPKTTTKPTAATGVLNSKPTNSTSNTAGTFTDSSGRTVNYSKVMTGKGTAYTDEPGAITASGMEVQVGVVAVDPKLIPYGTRLYIVSADGKYTYGYAIAADTGGALRRGEALVDLFYDSESQCRAFGRRDVIVYILGD